MNRLVCLVIVLTAFAMIPGSGIALAPEPAPDPKCTIASKEITPLRDGIYVKADVYRNLDCVEEVHQLCAAEFDTDWGCMLIRKGFLIMCPTYGEDAQPEVARLADDCNGIHSVQFGDLGYFKGIEETVLGEMFDHFDWQYRKYRPSSKYSQVWTAGDITYIRWIDPESKRGFLLRWVRREVFRKKLDSIKKKLMPIDNCERGGPHNRVYPTNPNWGQPCLGY